MRRGSGVILALLLISGGAGVAVLILAAEGGARDATEGYLLPRPGEEPRRAAPPGRAAPP